MKIHTDYYGEIEYSKEDLVTFPEGLFGFPDLKYYLPLCLSDDDDSMLILQSTEKPEVVFLFITPHSSTPIICQSLLRRSYPI